MFAAAIAVRAVVQAVMNEVLEQDERSEKNDNAANRLGVVRCLCSEERSCYSVECVEERESRSAHPRISSGSGNERDGDQNAAITREHERIHENK